MTTVPIADLAVTAYGKTIAVQVDNPDLLELVSKHLPYGWKPAKTRKPDRAYSLAARGRYYTLSDETTELSRSRQLDDVLETLESDARAFVARNATDRLFVHAAAVAWKGRAILIPGRSLSGKTTLAAELLRAGATYYSDEYAVLDKQGRVHPYAKPLSIRIPGDESYLQTERTVESLGARAGRRPIPIGTVLITQYRTGARWRPHAISKGAGALAILRHVAGPRRDPEALLETLTNALASAVLVKSSRGEAVHVVESVLASRQR